MGVPAFFRWLSVKYPKIVSHCIEEKTKTGDVNTSLPNPNKIEFDNLYLDMNGIIHPCTHPENKPAPKNEDEMFEEIFRYMDRIFSIVRPRRVLYLAIDGVAPRAKMNQQRSRRFRSAKEAREKRITIEKIREELLQKGAKLPPPKNPSEHFDSNCITPGTPFMSRLTIALQYYIYLRLNSDPGWKDIQVILSDANVPGEGEHKIMDFIRRQRGNPAHDPNTKHCFCGADADLIMLGLATHEPYFTIIREEFKPNQPRPCEICGQMNHMMSECRGLASEEFNMGVSKDNNAETEFIFIHLNTLREYLEQELVMPDLHFKYDLERVIDDWVFMCFFVGNDFLPHLPSLEIREKAIDRLIGIYKSSMSKTNGWLTDSGKVNIERVQIIMKDVAMLENEIFKNRRDNEIQIRRRTKDQRNRVKRQRLSDKPSFNQNIEFVNPTIGEKFSKDSIKKKAISEIKAIEMKASQQNQSKSVDVEDRKRKFTETEIFDEEELKEQEMDRRDQVKLWEDGYRGRYYQNKFEVDVVENQNFCINVAHEYLRGLCWVLAYYYQGCVSWTWYYPFHYAPFAEDFVNLTEADLTFEIDTKPFNPLEQLMAVFPADSKDHVPPAWHCLMTDSDSPVIDFYPTDFKIDLNGKRYDWQGVALLPFVDETRLLSALEERTVMLTNEERERNITGPDRYFVRSDHSVADVIRVTNEKDSEIESDIDPNLTNGVSGKIWKNPNSSTSGDTVTSPVNNVIFCPDIQNVQVVSCFFKDPQYSKKFVFQARLLDNVLMPERTIGPNALVQERKSFDNKPMKRMIRHSMDASLLQHNNFETRGRSFNNHGFNQCSNGQKQNGGHVNQKSTYNHVNLNGNANQQIRNPYNQNVQRQNISYVNQHYTNNAYNNPRPNNFNRNGHGNNNYGGQRQNNFGQNGNMGQQFGNNSFYHNIQNRPQSRNQSNGTENKFRKNR